MKRNSKPLTSAMSLREEMAERNRVMREIGAPAAATETSTVLVARLDKARPRPARARAPRGTAPRRRGSRRVAASRAPPDDDPDPPGCRSCGGKLRPGERTCAKCRQRASRARRTPPPLTRPAFTEAQLVAAAYRLDSLATIAAVMQEPPRVAA